MAFDHYRANLRRALWDWRERHDRGRNDSPERKDRTSGRADKRSARHQAMAEALKDVA